MEGKTGGGTKFGITKNDDRCTSGLTGGRHMLVSILRTCETITFFVRREKINANKNLRGNV